MTTKKELPLHASTLVADYLRPAGICSRSADQKAQRFGFHTPPAGEQLVCEQAKIGAEDGAGHPAQFYKDTDNADLYTQERSDEARAE